MSTCQLVSSNLTEHSHTTVTAISKTNTLKYNAILDIFLQCESVVHELIC